MRVEFEYSPTTSTLASLLMLAYWGAPLTSFLQYPPYTQVLHTGVILSLGWVLLLRASKLVQCNLVALHVRKH